MSKPAAQPPTTPPRPKRNPPSHHRTHSQTTISQTQTSPPPNPTNPHDPIFTLDPDHSPSSPIHTSFSPSKARHLAQQTHQQTQLSQWLETLLPASHPVLTRWQASNKTFPGNNPELSEQITAWLQSAMHTNLAADELHRLRFEAEREELDRLTRASNGGHVRGMLAEVYSSLSTQGRQAVDTMAESAVLLGHVPSPLTSEGTLVSELGAAVMAHTVDVQDSRSTVRELEALRERLQRQVEEVQTRLRDFQREKVVVDADAEVMRSQTAQWNRETKQILVKIQEYKDRVAVLERSGTGGRPYAGQERRMAMAEDVADLQERVNEKREAVKKLEERVSALNGLPPDLEASRNEVKRARSELERLKARREELFGMLAGLG